MSGRAALFASVVLVLVAGAPLRGQEAPEEILTALDDPGGRVGAALEGALDRAAAGGASARLTFWGASHTASDQYTSTIRSLLRRRVGDGGAGLVMPAMPFSLYEMRDFDVETDRAFIGRFVRGTHREPGVYGRAGMALDVEGRASVELVPRPIASIAHVELWAMAQDEGGSASLRIDGVEVATIDSGGATRAGHLVRAIADVPPGAHRIGVRMAGDGPVRLFGVMVENATPGVIVEAFGVPGARARDQLPWDEAGFAEQVAARPPDLVAIAYGTNESADGTPLSSVESGLREALDRLRRAAPSAACLVIGPSDRPRYRESEWMARPRSTAMAALYHRQALDHGCAFFDTLAWQGGAGAMPAWVASGLALSDHVHLTEEGYARMGRAILRGLGVRDAPPRHGE